MGTTEIAEDTGSYGGNIGKDKWMLVNVNVFKARGKAE